MLLLAYNVITFIFVFVIGLSSSSTLVPVSPFALYTPSRHVANTSHPAVATPSIALHITASNQQMPCFPTSFDDESAYRRQIAHVPPRVLSILRLSYTNERHANLHVPTAT